MLHINDIANKIQELLCNNEFGQEFRVYPYVSKLDRTFETIDKVNIPFVTVMMTNTVGKYRPIQNVLIDDNEFMLEAYFEYDKKDLVLVCFQNLAKQIVGKMIDIIVDDVTYSLPMSMDIPNIGSLQAQHITELKENNPRLGYMDRTKYYLVLQVRVYYSQTQDAVFGNNVKLYLKPEQSITDYEQLSFVNINLGNAKATRTEQILNENESSTVVSTTTKTIETTVYYKNSTITENLVKDMLDGINQNAVYSLKIEFPTFTKTFAVVLVNPSLPIQMGNTLLLNLEFAKANPILLVGDN